VIETVKEYLKGFYALLDQAKEEPNPGFALRPIDLISELDLYDVASLIEELRDGHTKLHSDDYYKYTFDQGLSMYSVINKDGTQVIDIDGKPAIDVIIEFARDHAFNSRDLRQLFTYRNQLPKNSSISYTLNCNGKVSKITREWQVSIKNVQYKSPYISGTSVGNATLIFDAFIARFYILQDFSVVLISTEDIINNSGDLEYHFLSNIVAEFKLFADKGIKKIILDLSNNGGGYVFIGHYINKLLFPNIQNFPLDYKVNDISIPFIKEISRIKNRIGNIFHYKSFLSVNTKFSFDIVNDFIDIIILTNGLCQSICAIIAQRLAEINVPTIAVGGFPNTQFSFAQYAVEVYLLVQMFSFYLNLKILIVL
ncbi:39423_t:CDS:2, partial [Gigaspora margarita]